MAPSDTPPNSEPVNERNWYQKMTAAEKAHPIPQQWRKQFTPQELEIIDRELKAEIIATAKAIREDLPGPRRMGIM